MGKSSKKSTKVDTASAVMPPIKKGKRGAEEVIEKTSLKKQKKNDGTVQAIEKLKSETKTQKKTKKVESSSSDESSESEEEKKVVEAVKPAIIKPAVASTNGTVKKEKPASSSDSSDDSDSETDTKPKGKVIVPSAKKAESSSDSDDSSSDSEEAPKPIQGKKPKEETSSDSSSEEENDKKKSTVVNKSTVTNAAAKKKDSSSDEDDSSSDEDDSSDDEEVDKVLIPASKNGSVSKKEAESSDSSDDSESDEDKAAVAPMKVAPKKDDSSDSSSESDSDDDETPAKDITAKKPAVTPVKVSTQQKKADSSESDSDDDSEESDDEPQTKKPKPQSLQVVKKSSSEEDSSEDEDSSDDDEEKPSKGTDVEMVDAASPKTEKKQNGNKAPQTPVTPAQSGGSKTLFVGNLPFSVENADIENFFKDAGKVAEVRFASDPEGNFKGFGHVEFATAEAAQKALELNGQELMGRALRLDTAKERGAYTPGEKTPYQKGASAQGKSMFIGGIHRSSEEDEVRSVLENHFAACGVMERVSVPTDRDTGELRGIAYIDFATSESLQKALELGGPEFGGYTLRVDEAKPRDGGFSGGGSGRSGGRGDRGGRSRGRGGRDGSGRGRGFGGRDGGGRSGGRGGGRGGGRFNKPNLAAPGTGKKTTFDD